MPHEDALALAARPAEALDAAHERGIVHRDVKPGNLLFDERGEVALADFGIARMADDPSITSTGEVLGTAAYLSPEQADGGVATAACDVYGLAVVAFELLTGTRPFSTARTSRPPRACTWRPRAARERPQRDLPPAVDDVLARGMAKDPEARFPTAVAFVDALERRSHRVRGACRRGRWRSVCSQHLPRRWPAW